MTDRKTRLKIMGMKWIAVLSVVFMAAGSPLAHACCHFDSGCEAASGVTAVRAPHDCHGGKATSETPEPMQTRDSGRLGPGCAVCCAPTDTAVTTNEALSSPKAGSLIPLSLLGAKGSSSDFGTTGAHTCNPNGLTRLRSPSDALTSLQAVRLLV